MKIHTHWRRHVEAWRESGLSQAAYCHQQGLNRKTFSVWTRRIQGDSPLGKGAPLELRSIQLGTIGTGRQHPDKRNAAACKRCSA